MAEKATNSEGKETKEAPQAQGLGLAYVGVGKELMKLGEVQLALKACERGLVRFPKSANIHVFRGEIYIALFNREKKADFAKAALASFAEALKLDPNNYLARLISAQLYLKAGIQKRAKALITAILQNDPSDERAKALLGIITKAEEAKKKKEAVKESAPEEEEEEEELVISEKLAASKNEDVVIGTSIEEDEDSMHETLSAKVNIFNRIEGLLGVFLIDANGQPFKVVNKAKLDVNVIPSMVFSLIKSSANGIRRCGLGTFQRGVLVSPLGTIYLANAFYATIALVVDNDADMKNVEKRLNRYLSEVTG